MPLGIIVAKWVQLIGPRLISLYPESLKITTNLLNQIYSAHKDSSKIPGEPGFSSLTLKNYKIVSFFSGQGEYISVMENHIVALLLRRDENINKYKPILNQIASKILENIGIDKKLPEVIRNFIKYFNRPKKIKGVDSIENKRRILRNIMSVSERISIEMMKDALKMDGVTFKLLLGRMVNYGFKIDGEYLIVKDADINGFLDELDDLFDRENNEKFEVMSNMRERELKEIIKNLNNSLRTNISNISEIKGSAIVTTEGLPIANFFTPEKDDARLSALTAALLHLGEGMLSELLKGDIEQISIRMTGGFLLVTPAGPNAILVLETTSKSVIVPDIVKKFMRYFSRPRKIRDSNKIENKTQKIRNILSVSDKISIGMIRDALKMEQDDFNKLIGRMVAYGFKIDGEYIIIKNSDIDGFITDIDKHFNI